MTLKIQRVSQDPRDPSGLSFVMQFNRTLTPHERESVQVILSMEFLPTEPDGPDTVVIRNAAEGWFTRAHHRKKLKALVAKAEAQAAQNLSQDTAAEGQAAARADARRRRLEAIDWDDDSEA